MKNYDTIKHVRGESLFADDLPVPEGTMSLAIYYSPYAHGIIKNLDTSRARQYPGVLKVITAEAIPGQNQIGGIIDDEPLLAENEVHYSGQPVALVVAVSMAIARKAARLIEMEIAELPVITDPREAFRLNELIMPPRVFAMGDTAAAFESCDYIVEGRADSGAQEHLYLETQAAIAIPQENGGIKIISSTQGPTVVQRTAARVLGLDMNKIEVDVVRVGGGFGGKEDQANSFAAMAALAAFLLKTSVRLILNRQDDMRITGKRHPYSTDFKIGLDKEGMILAYEATFFQNAGAAADLSPAVLDRTLFHCTNSYYVPNVKAAGISCRTNLPPNTAFRGFGGPQGMFAIEAAIYKAASVMGVEAAYIQKKNLLKEGDVFHYGQLAEQCQARASWEAAELKFNTNAIKEKTEEFNRTNKFLKKGYAFMPVCFGISFTNTFMNQASALVHIYSDGSLSISSAAVEMGQGVNAKLREVASRIFSISHDRITIESTNTRRAANTSPTAASSAADLNGKAVESACMEILKRLKSTSAELLMTSAEEVSIENGIVLSGGNATALTWDMLIREAFSRRVNLSAHAAYATPKIYFDKVANKGRAFNYHVYGTAIVEVTVDCLRGTYEIDSVKAVHDFGQSLDPVIDRGQAEGAILQGIGWMTMEEIIFDANGKLITDALSTYKVPDIYSKPRELCVEFLENSANPAGIMNSKAIGEPPLMYGIGAYFALLNALKAFRPKTAFDFIAPMTNERVLMNLYKHDDILIKTNRI